MKETEDMGSSVSECQPPDEAPGAPVSRLPTIKVEPDVRGEAVWRWFDGLFLRVDRRIDRVIPHELNPFTQTGAIANTAFVIALVTGVLLLLWYSASVHFAYVSVVTMMETRWTAGLVRSLHRYSSDACMFFVLMHALKLFFARRFSGSRWLAWVTGLVALSLLWFVGWLGYWLVWDEPARQVAIGTARLLDTLPIFIDPLSRSFLSDATINSLLFFVVFFMHMLVPLAMGVALWLHIARLSRPHFLTRGALTGWVLVSLLLLSIALPAGIGRPAHMAVVPDALIVDAWYLLPLALTDRLSGGALWALLLGGGSVLFAVPWWMARGRARPAFVEASRCNACTQCYQDCSFNAISMVPRTDGKRFPSEALVNPDRCVGCGICAGSCNTGGISLPWLPLADHRRFIDEWIDQATARSEEPLLVLACAESAGGSVEVDPDSGRCAELPGYACLPVPCAGWIHAMTLERALKRGAGGVLVVTCPPGDCRYREGATWAGQRLRGEREPGLRLDRIDPDKVRLVHLDRTAGSQLRQAAESFRRERRVPPVRANPAWRYGLKGGLLAATLTLGVGLVSALGYSPPQAAAPELVVSFKHPGAVGDDCRERTPEELKALPVHMRTARVCERKRASVRLRVHIDGQPVLTRAYAPTGLWGDGNSIAIERLTVPAGTHHVAIAIGDTLDPDTWSFQDERMLELQSGVRQVVLFDRLTGFAWN